MLLYYYYYIIYFLDYYKKKFYLLEVNTQPGMTELSLVPEIARFKGINFYSLIKWMINDASINR